MPEIIIKSAIAERFEHFMAGGRVLFFSAPAASVRPRSPRLCCAGRMYCTCPPATRASRSRLPTAGGASCCLTTCRIMQDENDWNALCELIRSGSDRRFVLLSRGAPSGCPIAFRYSEMEKYYRALPKAIR